MSTEPAPSPPRTASTVHQPSFDGLGTPLITTTFVVFDLETTGLAANRDRITEIGAVKVRAGEVVGEFATFVDPGRPIPLAITRLTGIGDHDVRDAPKIDAVLGMFLQFLAGATLVAHNAGFDLSFLRAATQRHDYPMPSATVVDTARLARRLLRDEVANVRLATLAHHFGAATTPNHRALSDARATVEVLHGLIERAGTFGATTLEDLCELARSRSDRRFRRIGLVANAPARPGVYRFVGAHGEVLYVGKATDLRQRLRSYFGRDSRRMVEQLLAATQSVTWVETPTLLEAEVRELRAIQAHTPRFNRRSTRPTPGVHIAVTDEPLPRFAIVSAPGPRHKRTIGPLTSRRTAELAVEALQATTGVRPCTLRLRRAQNHDPCLLKGLDRCAAPCDGTQSIDDYAGALEHALTVFDDPTVALRGLAERMHERAAQRRFEEATRVRRQRHALAVALASHRRLNALRDLPHLVVGWRHADRTEAIVLRHGALAASARCAPDVGDHELLEAVSGQPATLVNDEACTDPTAELVLVARALERSGARVLDTNGVFAETIAGGRVLADTLAEARAVARMRRLAQRARGEFASPSSPSARRAASRR